MKTLFWGWNYFLGMKTNIVLGIIIVLGITIVLGMKPSRDNHCFWDEAIVLGMKPWPFHLSSAQLQLCKQTTFPAHKTSHPQG